MSEQFGEDKYLVTQVESVLHKADGAYVLDRVMDTNMSSDEIRETVSQKEGIAPDKVELIYPGEKPRSVAGRLAVGFSKWNSKWDPKATDPNMN